MKKRILLFIVVVVVALGGWFVATKFNQNKSTTQKPTEENQQIEATLRIEGPGKTQEFAAFASEKTTALDLLKQVAERQEIPFETKEYPGMGALITSISGLSNDDKTQTYWSFYVNNEMAQVGASSYELKNKDLITFKYQSFKNN